MSEHLPVEFEYLARRRSAIDHAVFAGFIEDNGSAVYLEPDARSVHTYVAGVSGSGKSRFLQALILQDIAKGHPLCLIDPMGDLYAAVRDFVASGVEASTRRGFDPEEILQRFVFLDLADEMNSVQINPLEPNGVETSEHQVDDLMKSIERLFSGNLEEQRKLRNILRGVFMMTAELNRLPKERRPRLPTRLQANYPLNLFFAADVLNLSDEERDALMAALDDDTRLRFRRQYWEFYSRNSQHERNSLIQSSWNVFQYLLDDSMVLRVLDANRSSVHLEELLRAGKSLVCHLPIGANLSGSTFLGRFITTKLQRAAYRRPQSEWNRGYYLFIDEFHQFVDQTFADGMTNLRKYGLRLINAHQSQSQPPFDTAQGQALLSTIKANSRIKVIFRLDRPDAETMAKELFVVTAPRLSHYAVDRTESYSEQRATNVAFTFSVTKGTSMTWSRSHAVSLGRTRTLGIGRTFGTNIGKTLTEGIGGSVARSLAKAITHSESEGVTEAFSRAKQISVAIGSNWAQVRDHRRGLTLTRGANETLAVQRGLDLSRTQSEQEGYTETEGRSSGTTATEGETLTHGRNGSVAYYDDGRRRSTGGDSSSTSNVRSAARSQEANFSQAISTIRGTALGLTERSGTSASLGRKLDQAENSSEGESESRGGSRVQTDGTTTTQTWSKSSERGRSETETKSRTETESWNESVAHAFSLLDQVSKTYSEALQESRTDTEGLSFSERQDFGRSEQVGHSRSLGHTMGRTRREVYFTLEEKRELAVNQLQQLENRQCFVSTEALSTQLLETPYVPDQQYSYLAQNYPRFMLELQRVRFLGSGCGAEAATVNAEAGREQSSSEMTELPDLDDKSPFLD